MLIFSSLLWYAEKGLYDEATGVFVRSDGSESPFGSIPAAFWWSVVTMTTVGYGDTYPVEPAGKLVATLAMVSGILVLALPLTIIGTNFSAVYEERQAAAAMAALGADPKASSLLRATENVEAAAVALGDALQAAVAVYTKAAGPEPSLPARICKTQLEAAAATSKANAEAIMAILRSPDFVAALKQSKTETAKDEAAGLIQSAASNYVKSVKRAPTDQHSA